jgi:translation initiation factor 5A
MALKIVEAAQLKAGNYVTIDNDYYVIRNMDISKTGKHGHAKCRFDATSITSEGKKKVVMVPGHERFEVPMIEKKKAQILSIMGDKVSVMDLESFENFELPMPTEEEVKAGIKEGSNVEYWNIEGIKLIKRSM